jgi:hypothetical protein
MSTSQDIRIYSRDLANRCCCDFWLKQAEDRRWITFDSALKFAHLSFLWKSAADFFYRLRPFSMRGCQMLTPIYKCICEEITSMRSQLERRGTSGHPARPSSPADPCLHPHMGYAPHTPARAHTRCDEGREVFT